jgi:hypothetical protein
MEADYPGLAGTWRNGITRNESPGRQPCPAELCPGCHIVKTVEKRERNFGFLVQNIVERGTTMHHIFNQVMDGVKRSTLFQVYWILIFSCITESL